MHLFLKVNMINIKIRKPHTQNAVVVYVTNEEKKEIKKTAKECDKSMSRYLLDLHLENIKEKK